LNETLKVEERLLGVDKESKRLNVFAIRVLVNSGEWQDQLQ
jgi:hypothetical protein